MKTWLKTALLSGVLCCAVGAVLTAAGMLTGGKQYVQAADINTLRGDARKTDSDSLAVLNKQKISGVQALDLALDNLDLKIVPSDDDCCLLSVLPHCGDRRRSAADVHGAERYAASQGK